MKKFDIRKFNIKKLDRKKIYYAGIGILIMALAISFLVYLHVERHKPGHLSRPANANPSSHKKANHSFKTIKGKKDWVSVGDFGAKGDGKTDDTKAIQQAIDSLGKKGGTVLLSSNKTYRVTQTITAHANINFVCLGSKPAKIVMKGNFSDQPVLAFSGTLDYTTTLSDPVTKAKSDIVKLADASKIKAGDLMIIESNTPWYYDPRTGTQNLHKGELHKVKGVSGSKILLDEGLWDTYNKKNEKVTVKVIKPISVTVKNVVVNRPESKERTIGIQLKYCTDSIIQNVTVNHSSDIGIFLDSSYRSLVEDSTVTDANAVMTGYGIQSFGSSYSDIRSNRILNSRRGVDVSGVYPDNHTIVEFNTIDGGGKNEEGLNYLSQDTQYGLGTHSTANFTVFKGNILGNLSYGINIRSKNATIELNQFNGYIREACIILVYGKNVNIINNQVTANKSVTKQDQIIRNGSANSFLDIRQSYGMDQGYITVKANKISGQRNQFIKIENTLGEDRTQITHLTVTNNQIGYNLLTRSQPFYLINSDFPIQGIDSEISNNNIYAMNMERSFVYFHLFNVQ